MKKVQNYLVPPTEEEKEEYNEELREATFIVEKGINRSRATSTHYEEIVHPNEEIEETQIYVESDIFGKPHVGWTYSRFYIWFGNFDENILRPFFIRNYNAANIVLEDEYQELIKLKLRESNHEEDLVERVDLLR